ncbi:hypothetical protein FQZ97_1105750 [compost metagenome]
MASDCTNSPVCCTSLAKALIALAVSLTRSCPSCADSLDWRVASEVDTALRATSSTAEVISLTAVAACSISLFCCCRPWVLSRVTAFNSSAAVAS